MFTNVSTIDSLLASAIHESSFSTKVAVYADGDGEEHYLYHIMDPDEPKRRVLWWFENVTDGGDQILDTDDEPQEWPDGLTTVGAIEIPQDVLDWPVKTGGLILMRRIT